MRFYKCSKSILKWKDILQIDYKWTLPILVNDNLEVVLGNSLKDSLPDTIIIIKIDNNQREALFQAFEIIETRIAEEGSQKRLDALDAQLRGYFQEARKPESEQIELFSMKENRGITPELYIDPPPYDFTKHRKDTSLYNEGNVLMEEFIERIENGEPLIEIDMEIMKELL